MKTGVPEEAGGRPDRPKVATELARGGEIEEREAEEDQSGDERVPEEAGYGYGV